MAAAAILNYYFVTPDQPRSPFAVLNLLFKFFFDRVYTFRVITIWKFRKFGLKCLFRPPKSFFGEFWPPNIIFYRRDPIRPYLMRKHAFWAINGRDRSSGVTCRREQVYKKARNTKSNGKCPPYADPLPVVPHQPNFACGVISRISFMVSSFITVSYTHLTLPTNREV